MWRDLTEGLTETGKLVADGYSEAVIRKILGENDNRARRAGWGRKS